MSIEVEFYDLPNGEEPAKEFIYSLPRGMMAKMLKNIDLLEEYGPALRGPYSEHLEDGIFELRANLDLTSPECYISSSLTGKRF